VAVTTTLLGGAEGEGSPPGPAASPHAATASASGTRSAPRSRMGWKRRRAAIVPREAS